MNWSEVFSPDAPLIETLVRGSIMYLGLFLVMRWMQRAAGTLSIADILLVTLLADASQNGMSGEHQSLSSGLLLVLTIVFWDQLFDWLSYRSKWMSTLLEGRATTLIDHGELRHEALRRRRISLDELLSHLRQQGYERIDQVRRCCLETDGSISVIGQAKPVIRE